MSALFVLALITVACTGGNSEDASDDEVRPDAANGEAATIKRGAVLWPKLVTISIAGEQVRLRIDLIPSPPGRKLATGPNDGDLNVFATPEVKNAVPGAEMSGAVDIAFLDSQARVLKTYAGVPKPPPRRPGESDSEYHERLPHYSSEEPAKYMLEMGGGDLGRLGITRGDRVPLFGRPL